MYKAIKITFKNAGSIIIKDNWTDYDVVSCGGSGFIVIKDGEAWVAMYAADEVFSVVLIKDEEQTV